MEFTKSLAVAVLGASLIGWYMFYGQAMWDLLNSSWGLEASSYQYAAGAFIIICVVIFMIRLSGRRKKG